MQVRPAHGVASTTMIFVLLLGAGFGTHAEQLAVEVVDRRDRPVAGAVVALYPLTGPSPAMVGRREAVIDQIDKQFVPRVSAVRVGTTVSFPNRDDIRHHVYSFSDAKTFELPLYKGEAAEPVVFDQVGTVVLGCNIHDWMLAYLYVVDAPWFAVTEETGRVRFEDLPAGEYRVEVQHARLRDGPTSVTMNASQTPEAPLSVRLELRPEFRRSRAPRAGDRDY